MWLNEGKIFNTTIIFVLVIVFCYFRCMFSFSLDRYCGKLWMIFTAFHYIMTPLLLLILFCITILTIEDKKHVRCLFVSESVLHLSPSGSGATSPASAQPWDGPLCSRKWLWEGEAGFWTRCPSVACGSTDPWGRPAHSPPHSLPVHHTYNTPDGNKNDKLNINSVHFCRNPINLSRIK